MAQHDLSLEVEFQKLWRNKWLIIGVTILSGVIAFILTEPRFWPPEYSSTAEIVPPSLDDVKSLNYEENAYRGFGVAEEEDVERIVGLLTSDTCKKFMAERFGLYQHYGVADIKSPADRAKAFRRSYNNKISVGYSRHSTVKIKVHDVDPHMARRIAQAHIAYADSFVNKVAHRRRGLQALRKQITSVKQRIDRKRDTLQYYRKNYGIYQVEQLPQAFVEQYMLGKSVEGFHENYDNAITQQIRLKIFTNQLAQLKREEDLREINLKNYPNLIEVVNYPSYNPAKARPNRVMIMLLTMIGGFIVMSGAALLFDPYRKQQQ